MYFFQIYVIIVITIIIFSKYKIASKWTAAIEKRSTCIKKYNKQDIC